VQRSGSFRGAAERVGRVDSMSKLREIQGQSDRDRERSFLQSSALLKRSGEQLRNFVLGTYVNLPHTASPTTATHTSTPSNGGGGGGGGGRVAKWSGQGLFGRMGI
jgi:hypothetical protein